MFWFLSNTAGVLLLPTTWILLSNLFGVFAYRFGYRKWALLFLAFTPIFFLSLKYLNIGARVIAPLEYKYPPQSEIPADVDGMIILGGATDYFASPGALVSTNDSGERVMMALYARAKRPDLTLVVTGASRDIFKTYKSEASRVAEFVQKTFPEGAPLIIDEASLNTADHPIKLGPMLPGWRKKKWALVTSAAHMPRSVAVFEKRGWQVVPMATDFKTDPVKPRKTDGTILWNLNVFSKAMHEWFGLFIYRMTDKI